jgi:hypothetical protein
MGNIVSTSKAFSEEYVAVKFWLNGLSTAHAENDAACERGNNLYAAAYQEIRENLGTIPLSTFKYEEDDISQELPKYELCQDELGEIEEGRLIWAVTIYAQSELSIETITAFRDFVVKAFELAAQRQGGTAVLLKTSRQKRFTVTETSLV